MLVVAISMFLGLCYTLVGFNFIPLSGNPEKAERYYRKYGGFLRVLGPFTMLTAFFSLTGVLPSAQNLAEPLASRALDRPKIELHRQEAGTADKKGMYLAESTGGSFDVKMPLEFNDYTMTEWDEQLNPVVSQVIETRTADGITFMVKETPRAGEAVKDPCRQSPAVQALPAGEVKQLTYEKFPACEFTVTGSGIVHLTRYVLFPEKEYRLTVDYPEDRAKDVTPYIQPFLESLRIYSLARYGGEM